MRLSFALSAVLLAAVPLVGFAHGGGASFEKTVNGYTVDVGYEPAPIQAGPSVRFDFNLYPEKGDEGTSADFTDLWVRIERGRQTVFAGGIHRPEFGLPGITTVLPGAGDYTLFVRYQKGGDSLVEASFPFAAEPDGSAGATSGTDVPPLAAPLGALVAGLVLGFFAQRVFGRR